VTQSRKMSLLETTLNIGSGMVVAWFLTFFVLPLWGYAYAAHEALEITILYTVVSWLRSYAWRRLFAGKAFK
jgi:hypothetical protein